MRMGRHPKSGAVARLHRKGAAYYYVTSTTPRKWIALGSDKALALAKWAELEGRTENGTFADLFRWYMANAKIKAETRKSYEIQGATICRVFGSAPPAKITSYQIATYRDKCPPGSANVRIGLMKSIFAAAVEKGLAKTNPAREVKRLPVVRRRRYITDDEFVLIRSRAKPFVVAAMDLAYLIGCRPVDLLKLKLSDVSNEGVVLRAQKTGKETLFQMTAELRDALDQAKRLERGVKSVYVISDYRGQPYTSHALRDAWEAARKAAGISNAQFRDLRRKNASDDPDGAQKRLQHSTAAMTQTYIVKMPVVLPLARKL